ncbi:MAG: hypothetical protein LBU27_02235 [Candidatus Peribacteria bacterium]|jgi:hypothetical protein|nr:hypothetical protein [Candidatus Peribacteria bacterium]
MKSTKNKIAGELGTDRFMVDGWNTFNLSQLENPATLKVIDGDGKEVGINFKIKSTDISLDNNQTVNLAGVERKVILNKKGELEFVPLPKNK